MISAKKDKTYSGDIVAGSLLVRESRQIARLLLSGSDRADWNKSVVSENILQKRSPVSARRQARLIRKRLELINPEAWKFISNGPQDVATQFLLAAAIKHSRLLGDLLDQIVGEHHRTFQSTVSNGDWDRFFQTCVQIDPSLENWTESTVKKVRQVIFRIMAEAKYIDGTQSHRLLPVSILPEVRQYLVNHKEEYVLRCMEVTP